MRYVLLSLVLAAATFAAPAPGEKQPAKSTPSKSTAAKSSPAKSTAAAPGPVKPPTDARRIDENTYEHTDSEGKSWTWRNTPFGWVKVPQDQPAAKPAGPEQPVHISKQGDIVHFERPTPFGSHKWTRQVSELDSWEKRIYQEWLDSQSSESNRQEK